MFDWEDAILSRQEEQEDYYDGASGEIDCSRCPVRGVDTCDNRCMAEYYAWLEDYERGKISWQW